MGLEPLKPEFLDGKGEVTWSTFKFEVEGLMSGKFTPEQILLGIRRALKGEAGDRIRRLGSGATLDYVMKQLENDYGTLESKESIMKQLYM